MIVTFEKDYLSEMYNMGKTTDKKHRFQPEIIRKYIHIINNVYLDRLNEIPVITPSK
jgi:hypothetical protein